jgi:hypothetical protein
VWMLLVLASPSLGQAVILFGASLAVFLLSFSPFLPAGLHGIVGNVFLYAGITRPYGLSAVLPKGLLYPIFIASMGVLPVVAKRLRLSLPRAMELAAVLLLVLIPGSGEAYFIIPAIWGSVRRSRGFWLFTVVTYVFLLSGPNNLQALTIAQPWNLVWFTLVFWVADFGWDWHRERAMAT